MKEYDIRPAVRTDEPFLWEMLYEAARMAEDGASEPAAAQTDPYLAAYAAGWGRAGDIGVIAELRAGAPIGAAWARLLNEAHHRLPAVSAAIPEIAIAVWPAYTGAGVGGALLAALIAASSGYYAGLALSVRAENPAVRLYLRHGFDIVAEMVNRVGTRSLVMRRML